MGLFFKSSSSDLFVVQKKSSFGLLSSRSSFDDLGISIGDDARPFFITGQRFIGSTISKKRLMIGFICLSAVIVFFFSRAVFLQVIRGEQYAVLAQSNRYRSQRILPPRGLIYDRNGVLIAQNVPSFVLTMTMSDLPRDEAERTRIFERVSQLAGLQPTDIDLALTEFSKTPYEAIPLKRGIPYEASIRLAIEMAALPGFDLQSSSQRAYLTGVGSLAHVLGYTGNISEKEMMETLEANDYKPIDQIGKLGIEKTAEPMLRGVPGNEVNEVNAVGKSLSIVSKTQAIDGSNVRLGLDLEFQKFAENRLQETMTNVNATRGVVVALDPQTGSVRALVSLPSYDNNLFTQGIERQTYTALLEDPDRPLFNRAVSGEYPSGSTLKPVIAYAALAEGIIDERTSFVSTGGIGIKQWFFPDWRPEGHGVTDVRKAIADSVNTFFYIIGGGYQQTVGLGVERIQAYARRFGFGEPTGIDLPSEADGFLPTKQWKQEVKNEAWYIGDTYHLAIGQGDFLTTPLQLAVAISVIANGGQRIEPRLIDSVDGPNGNQRLAVVKQPLEDLDMDALAVVRKAMRQTVTQGSARSMLSLTEPVAGKTGTAQTPGDKPYHAWFVGFGPYENPNITLVVLVEEGGESNAAAVPLARELFAWWFAQNNDQTVNEKIVDNQVP